MQYLIKLEQTINYQVTVEADSADEAQHKFSTIPATDWQEVFADYEIISVEPTN